VTFTLDVELPLTVEATGAVCGTRGGPWEEPEPDSVDLVVRLGALDITGALPAEVLASLEADVLERLYWETQAL
jgi:hypothetical protein